MVAKEIKSLQHPLVKRALNLRSQRKAREEELRVCVSGKKFIRDLAKVTTIEILFYADDTPLVPALESFHVTPEILKKVSGLEEPDGWAAIVSAPSEQSLEKKNYILILDQVSDPGNLGTLWRTALAFGWDGIWLTPGCVDPLNDKALRAAQGATFRLPFERIAPEQIIDWATQRKATLYCGDLNGSDISKIKATPPIGLILGNEGQGPGLWTESASKKITIPISSVESLNVSAAGAVLLFAMRPNV